MVTEEFTSEICEELFTASKYTASRISWKPDGPYRFTFRAQVLTQDGRGLDLVGYFDRRGRGGRTVWGFGLSYRGYTIRSYDMAKYHRNPAGGGRVRGPHKHRFSSSKISRYAYKPNPIIRETNANDALMDFLKEANIQLPTEYQMLLV